METKQRKCFAYLEEEKKKGQKTPTIFSPLIYTLFASSICYDTSCTWCILYMECT